VNASKRNAQRSLASTTDLDLDPVQSAILGDKLSDIEAGAAAGIGLRILVAPHDVEESEGAPPHEVVANLSEALVMLRSHFALAEHDRPHEHL
jgi:histidinol phosphatase-like enzyme